MFIRSLVFIVCGLLFATSQRVNDTPGGTLKFTFHTEQGRCPEVRAYLMAENKTLYEGRWYFVEVGVAPEQAKTLSCMVWDSYFDNNGVLHNWLYGYENNVYKTLRTRNTPIPDKPGTYLLDVGAKTNDKIYSTLYYMDTEMFIFWEVTCKADGNHYRSTVLGLRNLNFLYEDKGEQIDRILAHLRSEGGINYDRTPIRHSNNCKYPRPGRNPYH